jgi:amino acid permease
MSVLPVSGTSDEVKKAYDSAVPESLAYAIATNPSGANDSASDTDLTATTKYTREDVKAPPKTAGWKAISTVMIADVVGVGVLLLASAIAKLGWVMGILMLFGFFPLNMYTGVLLSRTRQLLPESVTMGDMAKYTYGNWFMWLVGGYVYANMFFILGDYLMVTGMSLQMIFYNSEMCGYWFMLIAAGGIMILMQFSRTLHAASYMCWFNMACITISVMIALIYMMVEGRDESVVTYAVNPNLTVQSFFGAMTRFVFAYSGQFMYLELMAEMKRPQDFPKTFAIAGPYQVFMYALVGITGYYYKGDAVSGFIIDNIPTGAAYVTSAVFLFLHMLVTFVIKGQVLSRAIHVAVHPASANDMGTKGRSVWFAITGSLIAVAWVLVNAVPFFDYFSSILGAMQALPTLIFPAMFFLAARRAQNSPVKKYEIAVMVLFCFALGLCLMVFGMWDAIDGIISSYSSLGAPFSC